MKQLGLPAVLLGAAALLSGSAAGRPSGMNLRGAESLVVLDAGSGGEIASSSSDGFVGSAIADGRGGWFVGGGFTHLGGSHRVSLAHLLPTGAVDPSWHASIRSASGRPVAVTALARAGSRLYLGGEFGLVGNLRRPGLAAVSARTGAVVAGWSPTPRIWSSVSALAVAGRRLLVAGQFGYPSPGVAALDLAGGVFEPLWNAHLDLIGDAGSFNAISVRGSRVFVGGSFHVFGLHRNGLVALDARTGTPDRAWAPRVANCSVCKGFAVLYDIAVTDRRVYVSGSFDRVDGVARAGIAALDPGTGAVDRAWKPARGATGMLQLALAGSRLYVAGSSAIWALDPQTGARIPLRLPRPPSEVLALTASAGRVLVAGRA